MPQKRVKKTFEIADFLTLVNKRLAGPGTRETRQALIDLTDTILEQANNVRGWRYLTPKQLWLCDDDAWPGVRPDRPVESRFWHTDDTRRAYLK